MAWVQKHNMISSDRLILDRRYPIVASEIRNVITADDRIPYVEIANGALRNFWQDRDHVRGLWRQTSFAEYQKKNPKWETLLDLDVLNHSEKKSWVFHGAICLPPQYNSCLIKLSDAGKDEVEVREFDVAQKMFLLNGFKIPLAKTDVSWIDGNHILVSSDFGPNTLTSSGYPRQIRLWTRDTPLSDAKLIFEGKKEDVSVNGTKSFREDSSIVFLSEQVTFFESKEYVYQNDGTLQLIPFPTTSSFQGNFKDQLLARLRQDWQIGTRTFLAGSLVSIPLASIGSSDALSKVELVFAPDEHSALRGVASSKSELYLNVLKDVKAEIYSVYHSTSPSSPPSESKWVFKKMSFPSNGTVSISETNPYDDRIFLTYDTFNVPTSYYLGTKKIKTLAPKYDASTITFDQFYSTSKDGTKIPYFVVHKKSMKKNSKNPTLLYAYGGFEHSLTPFYAGAMGKVWLEKGGVYVLANIRGGGEFGPRWHESVLKENRQKAYDDFASIAEDLFKRKITSPEKLGIQGGSNGGLLMGVQFTEHPEYYKAVVCESALLDMMRYTLLPPGASWIGEYGDPTTDPKIAEAISKYSPYQNIKKGVQYPEVFFHTSTADDRVQPGHTRKVVARLEEYGNPVLLYENTEGGHGGAADLEQRVKKMTLEYIYLYQKLMNTK